MSIIPTQTYSAIDMDFMAMQTLALNLGQAIAGSADLVGWCNMYYGRDVSVFAGSDPENPPTAESYPLVEVVALESNHGREIDRHERLFGLICGLHDAVTEMVVYEKMVFQQGLLRLEEFYQLVIEAAAGADLLDGYIASVEARREDENLFPFFLLGAEILIVKPM